jgi:AraC-like DNA-binding protein
MTMRSNSLTLLAAVVHPLPEPLKPEHDPGRDHDGWSAAADDVMRDRADAEANWEAALDAIDADPVLGEIAAARRQIDEAEHQLRLLLAYAREFVGPRPYTLADVAEAAGMSVSGVRTAYNDADIAEVAHRTGIRSRRLRLADPDTGVGTAAGAADEESGSGR